MAEEKVKLCPVSGKPLTECSNYVCYSEMEHEWKETKLTEDLEIPGKMTEIYTGRILWGRIAGCSMGFFQRKVIEQKVVKEA